MTVPVISPSESAFEENYKPWAYKWDFTVIYFIIFNASLFLYYFIIFNASVPWPTLLVE